MNIQPCCDIAPTEDNIEIPQSPIKSLKPSFLKTVNKIIAVIAVIINMAYHTRMDNGRMNCVDRKFVDDIVRNKKHVLWGRKELLL